MDLTILIPCFNEADNVDVLRRELGPVVQCLRGRGPVEILFVDDGSADGTGELLADRFGRDPDTRIARHARNRGLGAALQTGFAQASGEVVVVTDSDGTYPFTLILPMLDRLRDGTDIVTASCYHPEGGIDHVPGYRVFLSRTASLMYRVLLDWNIHTYTCMFRAYRREVIESVPFKSEGFLSVTELLANALLMGFSVAELPCRLTARRYGVSKAKSARTVVAHLRFQCHLLLSRQFLLRGAATARRHAPSANRARRSITS